MRFPGRVLCIAAVAILTAVPGVPHAAEIRAAVASNFTQPAKEIGAKFTAATGHTFKFTFGSGGQLRAMIFKGTPFDVFLSADQKRVKRVLDEGYGIPGTDFTYAIGGLVLYSAKAGFITNWRTLDQGAYTKIAIANPQTEPYGVAAVETMQALGVFETAKTRLLRANNVSQVMQFIMSGSAELGFVAVSQVARVEAGSRWDVPARMHAPLLQDAVRLKWGEAPEAANEFLAYLRSAEARAVIEIFGYGIPEN